MKDRCPLVSDKKLASDHHPAPAAGQHFILDLWSREGLDNQVLLESAMVQAAELAGATLLYSHIHKFQQGGGITGVALLAESHISVHTWPENNYAAFDVFMCGRCKPQLAVEHLISMFRPYKTSIRDISRGGEGQSTEVRG